MKKFTVLIVIILTIYFSIFVIGNNKTVCDTTFQYRIGNFDEQFNISEGEFREALEKSESIWEVPTGMNLFEYDPAAKFTINLVFDERQQATLEKRNLVQKLKQVKSSQSNISRSYDHWYQMYEDKKAAYKKLLVTYEDRVNDYNREVRYWNHNGGAPRHIYTKLEREKRDLDFLQLRLEDERADINDIVALLQSMKARSHALVDTYTSHVKTYNSLYREYRRFHQGEYDGEAITIYQFNDTADLILVLAHEFGHALGLGHVDDPTAVMHYLMGEQDLADLALRPDDIAALKTVCGLD